MMETRGKKKKNSSPPSFPKRKKLGPSLVHAEPFIGCMELLFAKTVCHHFGPGLIPPPKSWGIYYSVSC
jgi:hypothetical protein